MVCLFKNFRLPQTYAAQMEKCDRCGADMVLNCKKIDGVMYTLRSEMDVCCKCRKELKQQDDESMLLAQVLG